ncbi:MAG: ABC transporter permease [Ardenticatenaceae bacterium]|nr:ABC transporter permease [Ardenticatenaceae bacterium]MCB9444625.1 ABC transporter permease [Ardenticatenaceae bacterium]
MQRYFLSKLTQSLLLLFGVLFLVFIMVRITGDPAALMMPRESSPEQIEAFREEMGFNDPIITQFSRFIGDALMGDFGHSLHFKTPAMPLVLERLPATVQLASVGLLMALVIGIPIGLIGGFNPGSAIDSIGRFIALMGQSVPNFWLGLMMILYFGVKLGWFPTFGRDQWNSVIMPAFVLGLPVLGQLVRLTRSAVLEIRGEDFIRTAHSKGLEPKTIYVKHVFRNVAIPLISVVGVQFGYMLGGSIYIEAIFSWPGMGGLLEQSIGWRDFPLVQAIAVFTSVVVLALNIFTDLAYSIIDPRIRYGR